MPLYSYRAISNRGQIVTNRVEDISKQSLIRKLKRNQLTPISVEQKTRRFTKKPVKTKNLRNLDEATKKIIEDAKSRKKSEKFEIKWKEPVHIGETITERDIIIFTQNFYLLKKANFNNIHALTTIIQSTDNTKLREILYDILAGVEAGDNMYTTMEYYPKVFPYIYVNIIRIGELSGSLTNALDQAVKYLEETSRINKRLKQIFLPNIAQFITLLVMLIVGTLVAIPAIQNLFDSMGSTEELPKITKWFSNFIDVLIAYWYIPVSIIAAATIAIIVYINTPIGKYRFHYFKYTMPIFGKLIYALDFSRFIKAVLLNIQNGTRLQDAIEVSKNVTKNYVMLSMIESSIDNILVGDSWIQPFEKSGLSSSMTIEMLKVGMQTDLAEMLRKLLDYMEIDIQNIMNKIMKALPQIVYLIVGLLLIFFVLVVLVPVLQVYMGNFIFKAYGV